MELVEIVQAKDPVVVFLAKTLTDDARLEFVQSSIGFDHRWVVLRVGRPHCQMQQFRKVIDECGFMDLGFQGSKFTWSKHFENKSSIWERLDRCLVTNSWFMKFAGSRVFHLTCTSSDHIPILISLSGLIPLVKTYVIQC